MGANLLICEGLRLNRDLGTGGPTGMRLREEQEGEFIRSFRSLERLSKQ